MPAREWDVNAVLSLAEQDAVRANATNLISTLVPLDDASIKRNTDMY
jgi:hypothetical protein